MNNNTNVEESLEKPVVSCCDEVIRGRFESLLLSKIWKQQDLADATGIDKANISRICNGLYIPCIETKIKIAKALDVDSAAIWRDDNG